MSTFPQQYVKELREKGIADPDIKRLKKKFKNKSISSNGKFKDQKFSDELFVDMEIVCKDCSESFVFPAKEQVKVTLEVAPFNFCYVIHVEHC